PGADATDEEEHRELSGQAHASLSCRARPGISTPASTQSTQSTGTWYLPALSKTLWIANRYSQIQVGVSQSGLAYCFSPRRNQANKPTSSQTSIHQAFAKAFSAA